MEIVKMKLSELNPAEYNPQKALRPGDPAYEKLKASILSFGNVEPIVWNRTTGNVIGGHQRLRVLLDLGVEESEVSVVDLSEVDEKRLNIALNKISGEWNEQLLADLLVDLQDAQFNLDLTGFEAPEIDQLFSKLHNKDIEEDNFDVEEGLTLPPWAGVLTRPFFLSTLRRKVEDITGAGQADAAAAYAQSFRASTSWPPRTTS